MIGTRAGFVDGLEVVEVEFATARLSFEDLIAHAERGDCARRVFTTSDAQLEAATALVGDRARALPEAVRADAEPKYYLFRSALRAVPMTGLQAVRVNATIRHGDPRALLSPRQCALLDEIERSPDVEWPNLVGVPIADGWTRIDAVRAKRAAPPAAERERR